MKIWGLTPDLHSIRSDWSVVGETGIPGVAVECADIRRNTNGEGRSLGHY